MCLLPFYFERKFVSPSSCAKPFCCNVRCMGITIHYRGQLNDIERVEDFEDRVLDFTLAFGASARIWRSVSDKRPTVWYGD